MNNFFVKFKPLFFSRPILDYKYYSSKCLSIINVHKNAAVGDHIQIKGWVKSLRNQKENVFIDISDGTCAKKLQIFISQSIKPKQLSTGCSVIASGTVNVSPKGQIELRAEDIKVCGECIVSNGYPFAPRKQYDSEYVRQYPQFRTRTNKFGALLRLRSEAMLAVHNYFNIHGFININTPILTSNDCEGAGETFKVVPTNNKTLQTMIPNNASLNDDEVYFGHKAYLAVSGQLHLEAAVHGLSNVYTLGPTFRAENSRSRLHLSEFYMLEAEMAFVDTLEPVLTFVEELVKTISKYLYNQFSEDVRLCQDSEEDLENLSWLEIKFPIVTYEEALNILGGNLKSKEDELSLVKYYGDVPVFVINWPKTEKPFYMKECENDSRHVAAFDLLAPNVGEIVGGSLREDCVEKLRKNLPASSSHSLDWYIDLRRFGKVSTGGFGLGFERYLQCILGIKNIKDVIPFPRWPHNCPL